MKKSVLFKNPKHMTEKEIIFTIDALSKRSEHAQHQILLLYRELYKKQSEKKIQESEDRKIEAKRKEKWAKYDAITKGKLQ